MTTSRTPPDRLQLHDLEFRPCISRQRIQRRTQELAGEVDAYLGLVAEPEATPLVLGVLNGAAIFHADLVRGMQRVVELGYLSTSSYEGTRSTGQIKCNWPDGLELRGRHVLLVEDIVDTGRTLAYLRTACRERGAATVACAVLLDKSAAREVDVAVELTGFQVPNVFVVGCGLDYRGLGRQLPDLYERVVV